MLQSTSHTWCVNYLLLLLSNKITVFDCNKLVVLHIDSSDFLVVRQDTKKRKNGLFNNNGIKSKSGICDRYSNIHSKF